MHRKREAYKLLLCYFGANIGYRATRYDLKYRDETVIEVRRNQGRARPTERIYCGAGGKRQEDDAGERDMFACIFFANCLGFLS